MCRRAREQDKAAKPSLVALECLQNPGGARGSAQSVNRACGRGGAGQGSELDAESILGRVFVQPARLAGSQPVLPSLSGELLEAIGRWQVLGTLAWGPEQVCLLKGLYRRNHSAEFLSQRVTVAGTFQPLGRSGEVSQHHAAAGSVLARRFLKLLLQVEKFL